MHIDGRCHCGKITFEAEVDPDKVVLCHCEDCQRMSGAPYNAVVITSESQFTLLSGTLKTYVKIAESGNHRAQTFCPDCGSRIYATSAEAPADGSPRILNIRLGSVNQRAEFTPKRQIWRRSAQPWIDDLADIPSHDTVP